MDSLPMKRHSKYNGFRTPFFTRSRSTCQFLYHSSVKTILISLALVFLLLCIWFWPRQQIQIYNYYNSSKGGNLNSQALVTNAAPLKFYSQDESLVNLLGNLTFKNYGIVRSSDQYVWEEIRISYVEAQNVSGPYLGWADIGHANYLFHDVSGDLTHPPSGMRSSVPLGGISTGNIELRGDGTFHEWSIFNQYPAGAAKIQIIDDVFMGIRTVIQGQEPVSVVLQTQPSNQQLPAVEALKYQGTYPVSKLSVMDRRLPVDVSVYAY
uniref:Glycosyl-hydrolase family 116 N-terminal domain-containing protein n=1 Tax=Amphimedon queenslandica TaxID=400682 RepID=A0A1X7SQU2_AMPQE